MKKADLILKTENYARKVMSQQEGITMIAHDFKHVDRVRNWALVIADVERFPNMEMVEVTALLHDVGLSHLNEGVERIQHGPLGAEIAKTFLKGNSSLSAEQIDQIADAIHHHSLHPLVVSEHLQVLGEKGKLPLSISSQIIFQPTLKETIGDLHQESNLSIT